MAIVFEQALEVGETKRLLIVGGIAEAGGIGATARELGWSQSALSQHMTALEKDLGVTFFDRTPRGIVLTTAGQLARMRANEVPPSAKGLRGDLAEAFGFERRGVLHAGLPSFVVGPVSAALGRLEAYVSTGLSQHHSCEVAEAEPPVAMAMFEDGAMDVAFLFHHEDEELPEIPGHITVDLDDDHLDLLVPERWDRAGQIRHLTDVADPPWIMGCVRCRSTADCLCQQAVFEPRTRHITDNPGAIQSLVSNGLGVALLPRSARGYAHVNGIDPIPVDEAGSRRVTAMIPDAFRSASEVDDLLDALRAVAVTAESPDGPVGTQQSTSALPDTDSSCIF